MLLREKHGFTLPLLLIGLFLAFPFTASWASGSAGSTSVTMRSRSPKTHALSLLPLGGQASGNITETNPTQTVDAYSAGSTFVTNQADDQYGNQIYSEIYGFSANPLYDSNPTYDYYIFDVYVAVSSASTNGWHVDSAGIQSSNGPSFNFTVGLCNSPKEGALVQNIWPPSELDSPGNQPQTTSVDLSYAGFSIGLSRTFTPPLSQTAPIAQLQCQVGWASASNYQDNPAQSSYSYNFAFGLEVQKGDPAILEFDAQGAFYMQYTCDLILHCDKTDHPTLSFSAAFNHPPITTVTSSPSTGNGFIEVDGAPVTTPAQFVWGEGNSHVITATQSPVPGPIGTRYVFSGWSDGQAASHSITSPTTPTTIVASFNTQYELNVSVAQPSEGTTNPAPQSWWFASSKNITVIAIPNADHIVGDWTIDGSNGGNSNSISVVMTSPHVVVASFAQNESLVSKPSLVSSSTAGASPPPGLPAEGKSSGPAIPSSTLLPAFVALVVSLVVISAVVLTRRR